MKKTNYVTNDVVMRWLNRNVATINMLQLLNIYKDIDLKLFMVGLEFQLSSTTNLACRGILIKGSKVY